MATILVWDLIISLKRQIKPIFSATNHHRSNPFSTGTKKIVSTTVISHSPELTLLNALFVTTCYIFVKNIINSSLKLLAKLILELCSSNFLLDHKLFCLLISWFWLSWNIWRFLSLYLGLCYILLSSFGIVHSENNTHFILLLLSAGVEEGQNTPQDGLPQCLVF